MLRPDHLLFTYLHLAPDPELTQGPVRVRRHLRRLRDGRGRARAAAAAGADERGGGQDRHPGRRVLPGAAAGRPRRAARRRAGRGRGDGDGHRRRRGRPERGLHRDRHGGRRVRVRPQRSTACASSTWPSADAPRPSTRSTLAIEEMLPHADLVIGAVLVHGARAPYVIKREQLGADEEARGAGGRVDRPGRLLRDLAARPPTPTPSTRSTA